MANIQRNFIAGRMNKSLDERLIPNGEYEDALNVRLGSTEGSEIGSVENSKGNTKMTSLQYEETGSISGAELLSGQARCLGAYEDGQNNRIYWFVHDPAFTIGPTGKIDLIVSFNPTTENLAYHVISINDGSGGSTTLNFNPTNLITGVSLVDDLLFFTDNINPPRVINVTQNYPNPLYNIDVVTAEELMVIKKPPTAAPTLILKSKSNNINDFLEERFICFAYRYQYTNDEYSATSQWSAPAFAPAFYGYDFATNLNEGMVNRITGVDVSFNSGSSLVKSIQILYKEITDGTIKVIDKLNKDRLGYADNQFYSFEFNNSKIFTVIPEVELLRLYDNVPLVAQAQTVMGNRLVYGNYVEGYDLKDLFNDPLILDFDVELITGEVVNTNLETTLNSGGYTFGSIQLVPGARVNIDLAKINPYTQLTEGASFFLNFTYEHYIFDPTVGQPTQTTQNTNLQFTFILPSNYDSLYALVDSVEFKEAIGTTANIKPVYAASGATSCDGFTLTDQFNCSVPPTLTTSTGSVTKFSSGIFSAGDPIAIVGNVPGVTSLELQIPAVRFVDDPAAPAGGVYEYYGFISATATLGNTENPTSLHSNRDYEIGIVYMDEFLRSSTALVSPNNTVQIPCSSSILQNEIQVTIPWLQRAPFWAKFYKFVIKPSKSTYETIYSEVYYKDPRSNSYFFLLEGENSAKVESGQRLIVKSDANGGLNSCTEVVVIDKSVKSKDFLLIPVPNGPPKTDPITEGYYIDVPAGPYMEIIPSGVSLVVSGEIGGNLVSRPQTSTVSRPNTNGSFVVGSFLVNIENPDTTAAFADSYVDYSIPVNSGIDIFIQQSRRGPTGFSLDARESRVNTYDPVAPLNASTTYTSFFNWFNGDNIGDLIETDCVSSQGPGQESNVDTKNVYLGGQGIAPILGQPGELSPPERVPFGEWIYSAGYIQTDKTTNYYNFWRSDPANGGNNSLWLVATGPRSTAYGSFVRMNISVQRANAGGIVVFETLPSDALPDVWYENDLSFPIDESGQHIGTRSNQDINTEQPAVIDTGFFDCYTFGNGVESYTIRDSVKGEALALGNRVTTTSAQEYQAAHRFADLTYSGVYNDESNINRLNEFNLGLLNFKPLEDSFGSIQKLYARQTDILTLQEDKISYVLAGKDLLTDSGGTGSLTAVPTVLGQQIARLEEFGISRNPESFAVFGSDKFFTDEQRGAVIQLKGGAYNNESLAVISEAGMRGWFRDLFHDNFDAQKIGGFDPYMNEYVLSANSIALPFAGNCDLCGGSRNVTIPVGESVTYCVNVTQEVGTVDIEYVIPSGGNNNVITEANFPNVGGGLVEMITETNSASASGNKIVVEDSTDNNTYTITALYNGTTTSVTTSINGILQVPKGSVYAEDMTITVSSNSITVDTIEVTVNCPEADIITIWQIGITSNADRSTPTLTKTITNQYLWQDGLFRNTIPQSNQMEFLNGTLNPLVSQRLSFTGRQGGSLIPNQDATVRIISNKIIEDNDNYDFQLGKNNFRFLRSATFYGNLESDTRSLLAASTKATPVREVLNTQQYFAEFTMPSGANNDNLYLIYDYRNSTEIQLCYSNVDLNDVCCVGCNVADNGGTVVPPATPAGCNTYTLTSPGECTTYALLNEGASETVVSFTGCKGNASSVTLDIGITPQPEVCSSTVPVFANNTGTATAGSACGGPTNTFIYTACNGVETQDNVTVSNSPKTVCSQSVPTLSEFSSGTTGTATLGASCTENYYAAIRCGANGTRVFLSADSSQALYSLGDVVYYDEIGLTVTNTSDRKCATIEKINWGNGASGEIIGRASGCQDTTYCPSLVADPPVWMFSSNASQGRDIAPLCDNTTFCSVSVYTSVTSIGNVFANDTLFFENPAFSVPFRGNNKYFAFKAPAAGEQKAGQGFLQGWLQIDNSGRVVSFREC